MHCGYNTELLRKLGPAAADFGFFSQRCVTLSLNPSIYFSLKVVNEGAKWAPSMRHRVVKQMREGTASVAGITAPETSNQKHAASRIYLEDSELLPQFLCIND
jgi:hypothetical protein